jgi:hypothetical protein
MSDPRMIDISVEDVRPMDLLDEGRVVHQVVVDAVDGVIIYSHAISFHQVTVEIPGEEITYWDDDRGNELEVVQYEFGATLRVARDVPFRTPPILVQPTGTARTDS